MPGPPQKKIALPWTSSTRSIPGPGGGPPVGAPLAMRLVAGSQRHDGKAIQPLADALPKTGWEISDPPVSAIESDCHGQGHGRTTPVGGGSIDPQKLVALIGCPEGVPNPPVVHPEKGPLLDFHGRVIGRWWIAAQLVNHNGSSSDYPLVMDVGGRRYCGKGRGIGSMCKGERIPSQKAMAQAEAGQAAGRG